MTLHYITLHYIIILLYYIIPYRNCPTGATDLAFARVLGAWLELQSSGRIALGASQWPHRLGRIALAASPWPHRPGRIVLAASLWPHRPGSIALAVSLWQQRAGRNSRGYRRRSPTNSLAMQLSSRDLQRSACIVPPMPRF